MNENSKPGTLLPAAPAIVGALLDYVPDSIVSRTLGRSPGGSMTFFSFDAGQQLSEHTTPFDAFVQVVDGEAELTIGGEAVPVRAGEIVLMPANVPHAVTARKRFKMLLTMLRG